MKKISMSLVLVALILDGYAQKVKLADVDGHYKSLQKYSSKPAASREWMDTLKFPPAEYGSSVVYLMVRPHYLTNDEIKSISETVVVPANSSEQTRKELDYLIELQNKRTPDQIKRVEYLGNVGYWPPINLLSSHPSYDQNLRDLFFEGREVLGESVNSINFPKTSKLLQGIMVDMRIMEFTIKYKYLRARPYHLEPALQPLARMGSPSFASGHTLWAFMQAYVWSELIPEKQAEFIALAEEIRRSREIMGIHFPSDNEASRQVAYKIISSYFRKDVFKNDLADAINEWKVNGGNYFRK